MLCNALSSLSHCAKEILKWHLCWEEARHYHNESFPNNIFCISHHSKCHIWEAAYWGRQKCAVPLFCVFFCNLKSAVTFFLLHYRVQYEKEWNCFLWIILKCPQNRLRGKVGCLKGSRDPRSYCCITPEESTPLQEILKIDSNLKMKYLQCILFGAAWWGGG